jgi:hypothetical protein
MHSYPRIIIDLTVVANSCLQDLGSIGYSHRGIYVIYGLDVRSLNELDQF